MKRNSVQEKMLKEMDDFYEDIKHLLKKHKNINAISRAAPLMSAAVLDLFDLVGYDEAKRIIQSYFDNMFRLLGEK